MTTKIIKIDPESLDEYESDLKSAAEIINAGGLVAIPTETVYGLGGDGTNPDAARKIYQAKGRPSDNPLIIHIANPEEAEKYTYTDKTFFKLAEKFMPGPLTVVMRARDSVPTETRGGLDTVAVRCPSNPIARRLIEICGKPIAAPSANLSGSPSPTCAEHVIGDMQGRIDMIIDGGMCEIGLESTIVKLEEDGSLILLRPGKITVDELACVATVSIADAVVGELQAGQIALSPGMKYRHYAPDAPLVLLDGEFDDIVKYIKDDQLSDTAVICYSEQKEILRDQIADAAIYTLGAESNIAEQAHHLFSILREVDGMGYNKIYAPLPPREGMGLALYNRMIRAAAHTVINLRQDKNG